MSYVDAVHDRRKDQIKVVERIDGERVFKTFPVEHVFYYGHPAGQHRSIFGDACKKFTTTDSRKFRKELGLRSSKHKVFESDIRPVFRSLATHYRGAPTPKLNIGYFDIEVEFDPLVGFAPVTDPFNRVNAISVYLGWIKRLVTLVLIPPTLTLDQAEGLAAEFDDTFLFEDEGELLRAFLDLIEDADVLTGWNSTGFDIPYLVNRITRVLGDDYNRKFCLWDEKPREREYEKFKRKHKTYDLVGRVHLDYLALYQKHNTQQLHSYRLDYVGEIEVGENKIPYEGTLDDLWKRDFAKFIGYNRQDTLLLPKIDDKKKFIELSNQIAHANCVDLKTTLGSVALVEQAIINAMHDLGFVVPDRRRTLEERGEVEVIVMDDDDEDDEKKPVCGAYVAKPKVGLHAEIGCVDINSLYPSAIRALNMSPETIVGQFRPDLTQAEIDRRVAAGIKGADAWEGLFGTIEYSHVMAKDGCPLVVDFEDGTTRTMSGRDWHAHIFDPKNHLCVTANGTIFSTKKTGMIPQLLAQWYAERQTLQGLAKWHGAIGNGVELGADLTAEVVPFLNEGIQANLEHRESLSVLERLIEAKDAEGIASFIVGSDLTIDGTKVYAKDRKQSLFLYELNDQRQLAKKILLNSLYGALLNEALRFYDARVGQSVTLTGRTIVRHMNAKLNEVVTGLYDYMGEAIIYADTDSCYFSAYQAMKDKPDYADVQWSREFIIQLYDDLADVVNDSFPVFMHNTFNTTLERGGIIKAGRELVASKGLFIKKKKYAVLMYDKEGKRLDNGNKPGKIKAMGLDLKRADTPKYMQAFLTKILTDVLTDVPEHSMFNDIREFREMFKDKPGWEKGTPKAVKALVDYQERKEKAATRRLDQVMAKGTKLKVTTPGHVQAALNWNTLLDVHGDRYSMRIGDGSKIIVCDILPNSFGMHKIAYPIDEPHLPAWFKALPFDHKAMETAIIDKKLTNLIGVLDWDLEQTKDRLADEFFVF